ncbi:MAG: hypothetical protein B7Z82_06600 [Halothiobacillus sp. 20-54-6]|nr:MAG: hypothetical protein B7Z82_06600 [Halothiobacillus sp. 20-54-6]
MHFMHYRSEMGLYRGIFADICGKPGADDPVQGKITPGEMRFESSGFVHRSVGLFHAGSPLTLFSLVQIQGNSHVA